MSLIITTDVQCDGCQKWTFGTTHPSKPRAQEARHAANKREGFVYTRAEDGTYVDLCPKCAGSPVDEKGDPTTPSVIEQMHDMLTADDVIALDPYNNLLDFAVEAREDRVLLLIQFDREMEAGEVVEVVRTTDAQPLGRYPLPTEVRPGQAVKFTIRPMGFDHGG